MTQTIDLPANVVRRLSLAAKQIAELKTAVFSAYTVNTPPAAYGNLIRARDEWNQAVAISNLLLFIESTLDDTEYVPSNSVASGVINEIMTKFMLFTNK